MLLTYIGMIIDQFHLRDKNLILKSHRFSNLTNLGENLVESVAYLVTMETIK